MAITLRSRREIELMRRAGAVVANVLLKLKEMAEPGITTGQLDNVALQMTADAGAEALFKGVRSPVTNTPFPGAICASINEQVVHGIPSEKTRLRDGDILSVDFGVRLDGYCGDAAVTIPIGDISEDKRTLLNVTENVLNVAIEKSKSSIRWSQVAAEMQRCNDALNVGLAPDKLIKTVKYRKMKP